MIMGALEIIEELHSRGLCLHIIWDGPKVSMGAHGPINEELEHVVVYEDWFDAAMALRIAIDKCEAGKG